MDSASQIEWVSGSCDDLAPRRITRAKQMSCRSPALRLAPPMLMTCQTADNNMSSNVAISLRTAFHRSYNLATSSEKLSLATYRVNSSR